jgi:elongation factor P--beta-lysine ligase
MIEAMLLKAASPLTKLIFAVIAINVLLLGTAYFERQTAATYERTTADRVDSAIAERDAIWEGKIEKANAATEKRAAEQIRTALQIQTNAAEQIRTAEQQLADLKVKNEQLPVSSDCGLGLDRGRMLPD